MAAASTSRDGYSENNGSSFSRQLRRLPATVRQQRGGGCSRRLRRQRLQQLCLATASCTRAVEWNPLVLPARKTDYSSKLKSWMRLDLRRPIIYLSIYTYTYTYINWTLSTSSHVTEKNYPSIKGVM